MCRVRRVPAPPPPASRSAAAPAAPARDLVVVGLRAEIDVRERVGRRTVPGSPRCRCEAQLIETLVERLRIGQVIGWFCGRMEFGPRALGARSILADPRNPYMRDRVNALVKKREAFRPFAPAVLDTMAASHFAIDHSSPFMLETFQVTSPLDLPAITHVDGSARVQTVDERTNPRFARLLRAFHERTGCPLLRNTSFNVRDEPIVCTPLDAVRCFASSQIDALVLETHLVDRAALDGASYARRRFGPGEAPAPSGLDAIYTFD
jgi:carbamoyltransferase